MRARLERLVDRRIRAARDRLLLCQQQLRLGRPPEQL
jgi:hypothetical protein